MSSLNVLCPNGRRQLVKVQPNTKILDIIDEVCKKQGYATNEYGLIHQRKLMDVSLSYRLSGIPNNAQLELKKLETGPRQFEDVSIALQMEDGSRLTHQQTFKPDTATLFDIINFYNNLETSNGALKEALDEKFCYEKESFPVCSYLNEQIIGLYQLRHTTLKDLGLTNGRCIIRFNYRKIEKNQFDQMNVDFKSKKIDKQSKLDQIYGIKKKEASLSENSFPETSASEASISFANMENHTKNTDLIQPLEKKQKLDLTYHETKSQIIEEKPQVNEFLNFKFPEETKGQQLNDLNELAEIERISKEPCDRKPVMFDMNEQLVDSKLTPEADQREEITDEFFDVTVQDLRYMLNDLKQRQNDEAPLMTKQMRELEQDRKIMKYSQIVIRVAFHRRVVLQGLFRPKEKVSVLYDFVREHLCSSNSSDSMDFYLFSTPPKIILNEMKSTLFECKLCPAALIYFKNKSDTIPFFKNESSLRKSIREANEIVYTNVHQTMRDIEHEGITWLQNEHQLAKNILNSSKISSTSNERKMIDYESSSAKSVPKRNDDDPLKKKFERFLGAKK